MVLFLFVFCVDVIANPSDIVAKVEGEHRERAQVMNCTSGSFWKLFACWVKTVTK